MDKYRIYTRDQSEHDFGTLAFRQAFAQAWHELPLLQAQPLPDAVEAAVQNLQGVEHLEVIARCNTTDKIVAYAAVALEEDIHVGECLSIAWCWVHKDAKGADGFVRKLHHQVKQYADNLEIPYCYTKTVGHNIITKYKGVNRG